MKFDSKKKQTIVLYLLEKIDEQHPSPVKSVIDAFAINKTTVYAYIKELINNNVIQKNGRNRYQLVTKQAVYSFKRSNGDLSSDTYIFESCFEKYVKDLPKNVFQIWLYTFSEMTNNVTDHSMAEDVVVAVRQNYLNTTATIFDSGIGIFRKIKEHFHLDTLEDAICELFKGKLTTDSVNHSGEGIFFSSKAMDKFFIYSDEKIFATSKYQNEFIEDFEKKQPGTIVYMQLSNHSKRQLADIFDEYADVTNGFKKTKIVLKNIFDTSPVSRSQAKRICNRLESFAEVIFDFENIDWMGQGFAHQIFSVFTKAHPDIKLTIINAGEGVMKMYHHVKS